jgi:hypothetical protein
MKFIANEKMKSENLEWGELIEPNEHAAFWHHEIVDSSGEVHIGVVYEDGAVETAYAVWDSVDTIERFDGRPILHCHHGRETRTLHWNREANELFCERSHRNTCNTHISRVGVPELLDRFLGISDHDWMELPETGHICINLPARLKKEVEQVAAAENLSLRDWVIGQLSEAAHDERSRASLDQARDREKRLAEVLEQIRASSAFAE